MSLTHPLLKVCGITQPAQAQSLARLGVCLIGLNFHPSSPRYVAPDLAAEIAQAWGSPSSAVGLFVNRTPDEIFEIQARVGFGIAQLHGEETLETIQAVAARLPVIRAFRVKDAESLALARNQIAQLTAQNVSIYAALIDGYSAAAHGGTGVAVERHLVESAQGLHPRLMLAGGLSPNNLAERLGWIKPWAIDVASGVEISPGVKDLDAVLAMLRIISATPAG